MGEARSSTISQLPLETGASCHTQRPEETVCTFQVMFAKERDRPMHCWEPFAKFFTKRPTKSKKTTPDEKRTRSGSSLSTSSTRRSPPVQAWKPSEEGPLSCGVGLFRQHPVVHCLSPSFKHVWPNTQDVINNQQHCLSLRCKGSRCSLQRQRMFRDSDLGSTSWVFEKVLLLTHLGLSLDPLSSSLSSCLVTSLVLRLTGGVNHQPSRVICHQRFQAHQLAVDRAIYVNEG